EYAQKANEKIEALLAASNGYQGTYVPRSPGRPAGSILRAFLPMLVCLVSIPGRPLLIAVSMLASSNPPPVPTASPNGSTDVQLPRVLGLFDSVLLVVGGIIGSGVFFKAQVLAKGGLGSFAPILGAWVAVGLHTLFGTLAIAELAAMLPNAGGPYVYLKEAYGRLVGFLWGWTEFWIIRTAGLATLACATAISLNERLPAAGRLE